MAQLTAPAGVSPPGPQAATRPRLWHEIALIVAFWAAYTAVRLLIPHGDRVAYAHAGQVLRLEHALGIDVELDLNRGLMRVPWLADVAAAFYATAHFVVTLGVLGWLYVRRPDTYRRLRTALMIATGIALAGFWLYPLAPPRFLGGRGFVDPVTALHAFGLYSSPHMGTLTNQLAAMPSMHAGWALWCAVAVMSLTRRPVIRALAVLYPALTLTVIFSTANHYLVDALAGFAVMGFALFAARHNLGGAKNYKLTKRPVLEVVRAIPSGTMGIMSRSAVAPVATGDETDADAASRRPRLYREILLIGLCYSAYSLVRNLVPTTHTAALAFGHQILHVEGDVHLNVETSINRVFTEHHWLGVGANYYYATLHFIVTIGVLVWLYTWHPQRYVAYRRVIFATTVTALIGFYAFPLAPPRMLPGFVDTVLSFHTWGLYESTSSPIASVSNQYAAMPSLHTAWSLWCAIAIADVARSRWVKAIAFCYPVATVFVIIGTANHYLLDAIGGVLTLGIGYILATGVGARLRPVPQLP